MKSRIAIFLKFLVYLSSFFYLQTFGLKYLYAGDISLKRLGVVMMDLLVVDSVFFVSFKNFFGIFYHSLMQLLLGHYGKFASKLAYWQIFKNFIFVSLLRSSGDI